MHFSISKSSSLAVLALSCVSACAPTPQGILNARSWQCGSGVVVTFGDSGIATSVLKTVSPPMEFRSQYKLIPSAPGMLARLQFADDKAMRPLFGGSMPLNVIDVGHVDLHLVLKAGGTECVCAPIKSAK